VSGCLPDHHSFPTRRSSDLRMPIPGPIYASEAECAAVLAVEGSQPRDPSIRLAGSYVNFLIVNGGIIAPSFDDPHDSEAEAILRSEEHTSELQSRENLVCRL